MAMIAASCANIAWNVAAQWHCARYEHNLVELER